MLYACLLYVAVSLSENRIKWTRTKPKQWPQYFIRRLSGAGNNKKDDLGFYYVTTLLILAKFFIVLKFDLVLVQESLSVLDSSYEDVFPEREKKESVLLFSRINKNKEEEKKDVRKTILHALSIHFVPIRVRVNVSFVFTFSYADWDRFSTNIHLNHNEHQTKCFLMVSLSIMYDVNCCQHDRIGGFFCMRYGVRCVWTMGFGCEKRFHVFQHANLCVNLLHPPSLAIKLAATIGMIFVSFYMTISKTIFWYVSGWCCRSHSLALPFFPVFLSYFI